ncbi:hypothetical protein AAFC00_003068 [Neodothiora populina]|uniref:Galactose oxidase n=1 Tax=Neodothiora populina TaxID=2781224 RepID=A0ABR3P9W0_9PEZI
MAEIAAGAVVAEQVVSTTLEGGAVAAHFIRKPTMPLKASFVQFGTAPANDTELSLARSHHTLNVANHKAYIFGGEVANGKVASNDIHAFTLPSAAGQQIDSEYACFPAVSRQEGDEVPCPRTRHAACVQGHELAVFGGCDESGQTVDSEPYIWLWDTQVSKWHKILTTDQPVPSSRYDHKLFAYGGHLILFGGRSDPETKLRDTWFFDFTAHAWTQLPDAPVASDSVAFADGSLYLVTRSRAEGVCHVYALEIGGSVPGHKAGEGLEWQRILFQSDSPTPGPDLRSGTLLPFSTGYGRIYLAYLFGCVDNPRDVAESEHMEEKTFYSDLWTYQVPSKSTKPTSWTDFKPAAVKDAIRDKLGYGSGGFEWAEVEVMATEQTGHEGMLHPGPRAFFGADAEDATVVLWGGINAKGEKEADGWIINFQ